ncbi:MAG: hypothetical protein JZU47_07350 [Prolixibacteraceae bacterium]|nr:hypothetical protein [Prolixibacteraceae bacterium]
MVKILIFSFLLLQFSQLFSQTYWKIENEYGDEILLTINVNNAKKTFEAYTRKDALKDIAGSFMYTVAKTAGKLKYPEIVFIEGTTQQKSDSFLLNGQFYYFDKQFVFSASISGNSFKGKYIDRNKPRSLIGVKMPNDRPIRDYAGIINSAFSITEKNLVNPAWLKSSEWVGFKRSVNELKSVISDDYELAAAYFWLGKKLPFSPYEINKVNQRKSTVRQRKVSVRELKPSVALLDANSLPVTKKEVDSIAVIIEKKGYSKLVVDLRGNYKQNPLAANELVNYLSGKTINAGVYLTRKWFDANVGLPKVQDYKRLFKDFSYGEFKSGELYKGQGYALSLVPVKKVFQGKVYILTDSKTSKVFEAWIDVLKKQKIATIVGQKTAGATWLTESLKINNEYDLILPVADYYTNEGKSLNKVGIEPDINVSGEDALTHILRTF